MRELPFSQKKIFARTLFVAPGMWLYQGRVDDLALELVDALMVDGLTEMQALQEIMTAGEIEPGENVIPQWYYRPVGWFRSQFCEEE